MGSARRSVVYGVWFTFVYVMNFTSASGSNSCSERDCLRCPDGACLKCARLIVVGSRACVDSCPSGYREEWSSLVDYMGRVCREVSFMGIPGRTLAVVVGTCSGAFLCFGMLLGGLLYVRHRKYRLAMRRRQQEEDEAAESTRQLPVDTAERREFLKHVSMLRCEAPVFLAMLNDTRRQVRELHHPGYSNDSLQAYRPVLRDLARILLLLNRNEDQILVPPADWETLFAWGERVLRRYKKQNPHQVAQAQLVNFLQVPIQTNPSSLSVNIEQESRKELKTFQSFGTNNSSGLNSSFKSNGRNVSIASASNQSLQELAISTFNSNYNNAPMANSFNASNEIVLRREASVLQPSLMDSNNEFNPCWEFSPANYTTLAEWSASRDYLVDDDFFTLGFRPQDEITTEL